jgi:hypothetical protein
MWLLNFSFVVRFHDLVLLARCVSTGSDASGSARRYASD